MENVSEKKPLHFCRNIIKNLFICNMHLPWKG